MFDALKYGFANYFNFSGKTVRSTFWYWILATVIISILLQITDYFLVAPALGVPTEGVGASQPLSWLYSLAIFIPSIAMGIRRLRDAGKPGWLILLSLIPLVGTLVLIYFFVQPSEGSE